MTVKALAIPIIYWISITSMAISTKIKANILSLNHPQFMNISATNFLLTLSSGVRSHFFFFHEQRGCEASNQANKISLPTSATLSFMGITRNVLHIFLFLPHFGEQGKVGLCEALMCPNQGVVSKNDL